MPTEYGGGMSGIVMETYRLRSLCSVRILFVFIGLSTDCNSKMKYEFE